jgi:hypothetical protein
LRYRVKASSHRPMPYPKTVFAGLALLAMLVVAHMVVITIAIGSRMNETRSAILLAAVWLITLAYLALLYLGWRLGLRHAMSLVKSRVAGVA